jgi:hypothetical protein
MAIVASIARATIVTTCRVATTGGGIALSPGVVFLGLAALGAVGFIAYQAFRADYEVTIEEAGMGLLKVKGVHLVKSGGPSTGGSHTTQGLAVAYQQDKQTLPHKKSKRELVEVRAFCDPALP